MPDFTARSQPAEPDAPRVPSLTERITEILREHCASEVRESLFSSRTYVECYGCSKRFHPEDFNDHIAELIAEAAEQHYRPRVEELGRAMAVLSNTVHELQERQSGLTQPAADPRSFGPDHDFLPVRGHPDDDECTYRVDGTDATYCGMSRASHEPWLPGAGE